MRAVLVPVSYKIFTYLYSSTVLQFWAYVWFWNQQTAIISFMEQLLKFCFTFFVGRNKRQHNTRLCFLVPAFLLLTVLLGAPSGWIQKVKVKLHLTEKNCGLITYWTAKFLPPLYSYGQTSKRRCQQISRSAPVVLRPHCIGLGIVTCFCSVAPLNSRCVEAFEAFLSVVSTDSEQIVYGPKTVFWYFYCYFVRCRSYSNMPSI
jgi:hypothetical protein